MPQGGEGSMQVYERFHRTYRDTSCDCRELGPPTALYCGPSSQACT